MNKKFIILFLLSISLTISFSQKITNKDSIKHFQTDTLKKSIVPKKVDSLVNEKQKPKINARDFTEWEKGFVSGLIATIFGFILTMFWDIYKNRRDRIEKDKIIKKLILDSLNENEINIGQINVVLNYELSILNQGQNVVNNIVTLKNDFWDLIKFHIPKNLLKKNELLKKLQDISMLTKSINETINSRENYRLNNGAMDNLQTRLRHYDELILNASVKLNNLVSDFKLNYNK